MPVGYSSRRPRNGERPLFAAQLPMNPTAFIVVSVLLSSAAAVGVTVAMQPEETSTVTLDISQLQDSLRELQDSNKQLSAKLEELGVRVAAASTKNVGRVAVPEVSEDRIRAAVEAYLSKNPGAAVDAAAAGTSDLAKAPFNLKKDLEGLLGTSFFQDPDRWKRAFEAGKMDEVIAEIEALAAANPNDPQAQMNLANAYMAYLQMDNTKWQMSMKADGQFDKVLALDENHWEARFTKAVSYTFWPKFLGKNKAAIENFETLIKQQESMPAQDHQAQTYMYLGNLLVDSDPKRAREIWQKGATRHPNSAELRELLNGN